MSSEYDELIMLAERRELESALAKAVRERDAARAKADTYERDWYEAKSEFGTAAAKLRESVRTLESALTLETRVSLDYQSQRDEARAELGEILAVIHRDGGHHTGEHGISKSVADAHATWAAVVRDRDEARDELAKTSADFRDVWESRDKVIEERDRARQACNAYWHDLTRIALLCAQTDDEYPLKAVERTVRERDEAHACLAETIADVEEARAALGEAWMTGGVSLAEGIRRKTAALERLR
jgi:hypothetical protein